MHLIHEVSTEFADLSVWHDSAVTDGFAYIGYCNGSRSVSASDPNTALRALYKKHGPTHVGADIVSFADAKEQRGK